MNIFKSSSHSRTINPVSTLPTTKKTSGRGGGKKKKEEKEKKNKKEREADKRQATIRRQNSEFFPEIEEARRKKRLSFRDFLVYSPWVRLGYVLLLCVLVGFVVPLVLNVTGVFTYSEPSPDVYGTCHIVAGVRTDCMPDVENRDNVTEEECVRRGCCYQDLNLGIDGAPLCHHTMPSMHLLNLTSNGVDNADVSDANLVVSFEEDDIKDSELSWPDSKSVNVAYQKRMASTGHMALLFCDNSSESRPDIPDNGPTTGFNVTLRSLDGRSMEDLRVRLRASRNDSRAAELFDMSYGSLILGESISELTFVLPRPEIYGLGGHPYSFERDSAYKSKTMYNVDETHQGGQQHPLPIFIARDSRRKHFGVYIETENPVTLQVLPGLNDTDDSGISKPMVVARTMGGWILVHVYEGPTPREVLRQLTGHLGRPKFPPAFAMGYHVCRKTNNETGFVHAFNKMIESRIPFDSDCIDEGLIPTAFEISDEFRLHIHEDLEMLRNESKKLVVSFPVQIREGFAPEEDFYITYSNGSNVMGIYNDRNVLLPDFTHPSLPSWWEASLRNLSSELENSVEGITFVHNSPLVISGSGSCNMSEYAYIPSAVGIEASDGLCPSSTHNDGRDHLSIHNTYPYSQMQTTSSADRNLQLFTKYSSPGVSPLGGVYVSSLPIHDWSSLRASLKEAIELGLSGIPLVSMTACGTPASIPLNATIDDDLCLRWYQMAAFMPAMSSFHGSEDPTKMPYDLPGTYLDWVRRAIDKRYRLMPYFRTVMMEALVNGWPFVRPMFFEFSDSDEALVHEIFDQFMVGDSLLVSPILDEGTTQLQAYFPYSTWYDLWSGQAIRGSGEYKRLEDIPYQIAVHLKSGKIIPTLEYSGMSVDESYAENDYVIMVALNCDVSPMKKKNPKGNFPCSASGRMYLEGSSPGSDSALTFNARSTSGVDGELNIGDEGLSWNGCGMEASSNVTGIIVYGLSEMPSAVFLPDDEEGIEVGTDIGDQAFYDVDLERLQVTDLEDSLSWCEEGMRTITWVF